MDDMKLVDITGTKRRKSEGLTFMFLETDSKNKNVRDLYRAVSDFKKGYQPRTNVVKDEKNALITGSHSILMRWRNHLSQLLNVNGVNDIRQT